MEWNRQQSAALTRFDNWMQKGAPGGVFRLFGYAGVGKTTLAIHLANTIPGEVLFAAPTGKAAYVMAQKGCEGASTVHKLIYQPANKSRARYDQLAEAVEKADAARRPELERKLREEAENLKRPSFSLNLSSALRSASLLVLDEASMIDQQMGEDLLSFKTPILVLGDPAQLPPVRGAGYFTSDEPDVLLTEIHRQARENPILRVATDVREGREVPEMDLGEVRVLSKRDATAEMFRGAEQLLVGRNKTRAALNRRMRELAGIDVGAQPYPVGGDRLVCLQNNHEIGLLNGAIFRMLDDAREVGDHVNLSIAGEDGEEYLVTAHPAPFLGEEVPWYERREVEAFDYGYALTVHKAQGSQWDDVLLVDDWTRTATRRQWLYTGITRAAERLTIVKW